MVCACRFILLDPDEGCLTYSSVTDLEVEDEWEDELEGFVEEEDDEEGMLYEDDEKTMIGSTLKNWCELPGLK